MVRARLFRSIAIVFVVGQVFSHVAWAQKSTGAQQPPNVAPSTIHPLRPQPPSDSAAKLLQPNTNVNPSPAATAKEVAPPANKEGNAPKRDRSAAQKANDERMRQCGAEWRQNKNTLQQQGKTWQAFLPECNSRIKAQNKQ